MDTESVELRTSTQQPSHPGFSLPPADGGREAWLFLAGSFVVEALVWGFPYSYGIFQDYYSTHEPFASQPSGIAAIGTTAMGIMFLGGPVGIAALLRWPSFRRKSTALGLGILALALVSSSFADEVWQLILTQGMLYGIGGALLYFPVILLIDEWFVRRKGVAFGAMMAGTGFSGVTVPYIFSWGLEVYSFRTMLRAWAVAVVALAGPLLYFVKPRIPTSQASAVRRFNLGFLLSRKFLVLQAGNVLQGLGYFVPGIYLPTFARSLYLSSAATTATIAVLNGSAVFGSIFVGLLIDRYHVTTVLMIMTVGAVVSVFVFWGLAASIPLLLTFSIFYGFFAGPYTSAYPGIVREVKENDNTADAGIVIGFLSLGRGIGSIACGPMSESLLRTGAWKENAALAYGSGYGCLIVFTGLSALLGGLGFGVRRMGWL